MVPVHKVLLQALRNHEISTILLINASINLTIRNFPFEEVLTIEKYVAYPGNFAIQYSPGC